MVVIRRNVIGVPVRSALHNEDASIMIPDYRRQNSVEMVLYNMNECLERLFSQERRGLRVTLIGKSKLVRQNMDRYTP